MNIFKILKNFLFLEESSKGNQGESSSPVPMKIIPMNNDAEKVIVNGEMVPRYPPFVSGLPVIDPETLIKTQKELVDSIRHILALPPKDFDSLILPLIINFASFVHLLPASESHHHRGAGGLLRHSLEAGMWAAQFAEGRIFAFGKTPIERKAEEPRWIVATFVAAILHDIGKSATDMAVVSSDGGVEWSPYIETLYEWALKNNVDRYYIRWRDNRHKNHEQAGILLSNQVLPLELKSWLTQSNPEILRAMLEGSTCRGDHVVTNLVIKADSTSVEKDLKNNQSMGIDPNVGVPVERHILDASRRLMSRGDWTVNKKGGRVWVSREGVFIAWAKAADEITRMLSEDKVMGIPRDPDTIADLLIDRNIATERDIDGHPYRYWDIAPEILAGKSGLQWLRCIKLTNPEVIFSSEPPMSETIYIKDSEMHLKYLESKAALLETSVDDCKKDQDKNKEDAEASAKAKGISLPSLKKSDDDVKEDAPHLEKDESKTNAIPPAPAQGEDDISNDDDKSPQDDDVFVEPKPQSRKPVLRQPVNHNDSSIAPVSDKKVPDNESQQKPISAEKKSPKSTIAPLPQSMANITPSQSQLARNAFTSAVSYFNKIGNPSTDIFVSLLEDIEQGKESLDTIFSMRMGVGSFQFPAPFLPYHIVEKEFLNELKDSGVITFDPHNANRLVGNNGNIGKCIFLNKEISNLLNDIKKFNKNGAVNESALVDNAPVIKRDQKPATHQSSDASKKEKKHADVNKNKESSNTSKHGIPNTFKDAKGHIIQVPDYIDSHNKFIIYECLHDFVKGYSENPDKQNTFVDPNDDRPHLVVTKGRILRHAVYFSKTRKDIEAPSIFGTEGLKVVNKMASLEIYSDKEIKVIFQ